MVDASQLQEKELKAYRKDEEEEMCTLLNHYLDFCRDSLKVWSAKLANSVLKIMMHVFYSLLVDSEEKKPYFLYRCKPKRW